MRNQIISLTNKLRGSYWFLPLTMTVAAILFALIMVEIDQRIGEPPIDALAWVYINTPEGARSVLSTIASSMMTVAGVVFSLTMVVLTLTSQQYGSLALSNFLRDRGNQIVLGTFTATFVYCLLVMRTIQAGEEETFVPHFASLIGVGLALASLAVLIYFIHHISDSIQGARIMARIGGDLAATIDEIYSDEIDPTAPEEDAPPTDLTHQLGDEGEIIRAKSWGYVQLIDYELLLQAGLRHKIVIEMHYRPGDFVIEKAFLGRVYPQAHMSAAVENAINDTLLLGDQRTQSQDIGFLFLQLVEIAVRALSPGINAQVTAVMCINQLGQALSRLGNRQFPPHYHYDDAGALRVISRPAQYTDFLKTAFAQIQQYGSSDLSVMTSILETLHRINESLTHPARQAAITTFAKRAWSESRRHMVEDSDRKELDMLYEKLFGSSTS